MERIVKGLWIPIEIWEDDNLSWVERIMLVQIDSFTAQGRPCFFSDEYLAEVLKCGVRTAQRALAHLIELGYVRRSNFDGRHRYVESTIRFAYGDIKSVSPMAEQVRQIGGAGTPQSTLQVRQNGGSQVDITSLPDSNIYNNKNQGDKTPAPTRGKTSPFNFREALISIGVTADVADAWIAVRKTKRATNTKVAFEGTMREIQKAGASADDCIRASVEQSWAGFRADWYARLQTPLTPTAPAPSRYETVEEHNRRVLEATRRRIAERYGTKEHEKEGER